MLYERYQTQQSQLNTLSNKIVRDFVEQVAKKIPGKTKYESLLHYFLGLNRKKEGAKLFSKVYQVGSDKIRYTFIYEQSYAEDFPGYFLGNEIQIGFAQGNFDFLWSDSNLSKVNVIVDRLKEAIVHETSHFYQKREGKKLDTTVFSDTFGSPEANRLGNLVYITHDTELEAIANEAYKMYQVHKRTDRMSYYQCFLLKIVPQILSTYKYNNKIRQGTFDVGDVVYALKRKGRKGIADLFAFYYVFYGFLPQTKFGEMIKQEDSTYEFYSKDIPSMMLLIDNRDEITELLELVVEHDKQEELEILVNKLIRNGKINQLCSWEKSNARIVEQIAQTLLS